MRIFGRIITLRPDAELRRAFSQQVKKDSDKYGDGDALAEAMRDWVAKREGADPPQPEYLNKGARLQFSLLNLNRSQFSA